MSILNVFRQDPFTEVSLTEAVQRNPFNPTGIGELKLFEPKPIRTTSLAVEQKQGKLIIIPTSERGSPGVQRTTEKRQARYFKNPRLAHGDTIYADELQDVREFGTESVMMQLQTEVASRVAGPTGLQASMEYTWERHRLGAVQGKLIDADGEILYDWLDEFGYTRPEPIVFSLYPSTNPSYVEGALRQQCNQLVRTVARLSQGAFNAGTRVMGMCGDAFWDALTTSGDVTKTYYNWEAARELRKGSAFEAMSFGGIDWFNYRGSDDTVSIAIPSNEVKFFPKNAPGIFSVAYAPGEGFQWANKLGKPLYVIPIIDRERNEWVRFEVKSYPLHICTRPEVLQSGVAN
jgi:hypothetical protein